MGKTEGRAGIKCWNKAVHEEMINFFLGKSVAEEIILRKNMEHMLWTAALISEQ